MNASDLHRNSCFTEPTQPHPIDQAQAAHMKRSDPHHADSDLAPETPPPAQKRQRRLRPEPLSKFLELSTDVLRAELIPQLGFRELSALGCCNSVLRELTVRSFSRSTCSIPVSDCTVWNPVHWMSSARHHVCRDRTVPGGPYTSGGSTPRTPRVVASKGPRN